MKQPLTYDDKGKSWTYNPDNIEDWLDTKGKDLSMNFEFYIDGDRLIFTRINFAATLYTENAEKKDAGDRIIVEPKDNARAILFKPNGSKLELFFNDKWFFKF